MKTRRPVILKTIESLRSAWTHERWLRDKFCRGKHRAKKIQQAEDMLKKLESIEQWCRARMSEDEWKEVIG